MRVVTDCRECRSYCARDRWCSAEDQRVVSPTAKRCRHYEGPGSFDQVYGDLAAGYDGNDYSTGPRPTEIVTLHKSQEFVGSMLDGAREKRRG